MFNLAQKRMDFTFDENGICSTKWTSSSQVNMSDELFDCFINMINFTNEVTNDLYEMQWINPPRLKSGSESGSESGGNTSYTCNPSDYSKRINNCGVRSLYDILFHFGSPYSYTIIDGWICDKNYYEYNRKTKKWLVNHYITVLSHFLSGAVVSVDTSSLTNSNSSKCILILKGSPGHAVIYTRFSASNSGTEIHYYDPSGTSANSSCPISDVLQAFKATGYK
jgi:hypothetical protein